MRSMFDHVYTALPQFVLADDRLSPAEKYIYSAILYFNETGDGCYAGNDYFVRRFGFAPSTVSHALTRLESLGYIRREHPGPNKRYIYAKGREGS